MSARHFYKQYCHECIAVHWVEVTEARRVICHGENFYPKDSATHYTRSRSGGIDLVEKYRKAAPLPLEWQMAEEAATIHDDAFLDLGI